MADWILAGGILLGIIFSVRSIYKQKKKKGCTGCCLNCADCKKDL